VVQLVNSVILFGHLLAEAPDFVLHAQEPRVTRSPTQSLDQRTAQRCDLPPTRASRIPLPTPAW
jgi:hypothetical protein